MYPSFDIAPVSVTGIGIAFFCSFVIGLERQWSGKPAGIRTSILICLGAYTFVRIAFGFSPADAPVRVLGQIVTGIGFLGAGVIIARNGLIAGVTSASIIWILAAIGCMIAFGYYASALLISCICVFVLVGISYLEKVFKGLKKGVHRDPGEGELENS